jgi:hypothetical protein
LKRLNDVLTYPLVFHEPTKQRRSLSLVMPSTRGTDVFSTSMKILSPTLYLAPPTPIAKTKPAVSAVSILSPTLTLTPLAKTKSQPTLTLTPIAKTKSQPVVSGVSSLMKILSLTLSLTLTPIAATKTVIPGVSSCLAPSLSLPLTRRMETTSFWVIFRDPRLEEAFVVNLMVPIRLTISVSRQAHPQSQPIILPLRGSLVVLAVLLMAEQHRSRARILSALRLGAYFPNTV